MGEKEMKRKKEKEREYDIFCLTRQLFIVSWCCSLRHGRDDNICLDSSTNKTKQKIDDLKKEKKIKEN